MNRRFLNVVGVALVCSALLLGAGQVLAATPGSGPDTAIAPASGWSALAVGGRVWYAFQYASDGSQINVNLGVGPSNSVTFGVWTPADLANWQNGGGEHPVGRGNPDSKSNGGLLVWSGNFNAPGTYYVVVDQTGPVAGNYSLSITGSGVTFAMPAAPQAMTAPAAMTSTTAAPAAMTASAAKPAVAGASAAGPTGMGPDTAKTSASGWSALAVGGRVWYAFQYAGDGSQINVNLGVGPSNSVTFGVWTPADLANWQNGGGEHPVGRGNPDSKSNGGLLVWSGNFNAPGTYYVVVDQTGPVAGNYSLSITGSGVTFAMPAAK